MKKHVLSLFFQISESPVGCNSANCRHGGSGNSYCKVCGKYTKKDFM